MNPIMMDMMAKAWRAEVFQKAEKRKLFNTIRKSGDHRYSLMHPSFSLAAIGVIILLVVLAVMAG